MMQGNYMFIVQIGESRFAFLVDADDEIKKSRIIRPFCKRLDSPIDIAFADGYVLGAKVKVYHVDEILELSENSACAFEQCPTCTFQKWFCSQWMDKWLAVH